MWHPKMLQMWAKRYIEIAKKSGNATARNWASTLLPKESVPEVKKIVEDMLNIKRG